MLVEKDQAMPLTLGEDAIISLRVDPAPSVEADLVFAGFGLSNTEAGHDDFRGLDVRGKIVVFLMGALRVHPRRAGCPHAVGR